MALKFKRRRTQNVTGNLFVDESCIDCDACRWMAPATYKRVGLGAAVHKQPGTESEVQGALRAVLACPTGSIRSLKGDPRVKAAFTQFPVAVAPDQLKGIFHLGFHTVASGGSTPYLIVPPSRQNIMVDVPRYSKRLADLVDAAGGVRYLFLTHGDNAHGHAAWKARFPAAERVMHAFDTLPHTRRVERRIDGDGPWQLDPEGTAKIVYTPGHTYGSCALLYAPARALFTGDAVGWSWRRDALDGWSRENRAGLPRQAASMRALAEEDFEWMLPGRGRQLKFANADERRGQLLEAADAFEAAGQSFTL
ncbi:beta-lactamase-like protein [Tribonema minus]|uniref:Beta-lactamase-like protein n=1 Tax=Tribonema minus TaxID=303371 RepID=A0A835ZBL0_9STRA|nr:beta-lactamase-like protein [Tribonema minus]